MPEETTANDTQAESAATSQEDTTSTAGNAETTEGQEPESKQYSAAYVEELRKEAAQNRIKAKKAEDALKQRQDADLSETERMQKRLAELEEAEKGWATEKQTILLTQAVTSEATKAGAKYPDLIIRSLDRNSVEFDNDGNPTNLGKVIGALRTDYPDLFRSTTGSADGGATNALIRPELRPGIDRLNYAYENESTTAKKR